LVVRLAAPPPAIKSPVAEPTPSVTPALPAATPRAEPTPARRPERQAQPDARRPQEQPSEPLLPPAPLVPTPTPEPHRAAPTPLPKGDLEAVYERLAQDDQLYPEEAAKRGLGGEVLLVVNLGEDGRVIAASVANSSGHRILDDAAVRAVRRLEQLGAAHAGKSFLLTIRFVP
jgi:protein TonB